MVDEAQTSVAELPVAVGVGRRVAAGPAGPGLGALPRPSAAPWPPVLGPVTWPPAWPAAAALAVVNHGLLCRAPALRPVRAIRRVYRDLLKPAFAGIGAREVVVISLAAGIGEELLFRGVLQPEIGLIPASLVFGVLHTGGRGTFAFGCWVALMGAALGWLAAATGGLLAPIVAHALYDAVGARLYPTRTRVCGRQGGRRGVGRRTGRPGGRAVAPVRSSGQAWLGRQP